MVPMERLALKQHSRNDSEDYQRHDFLYNFQLNKRERTTIPYKTDTVGRYGHAIFNECYRPRENDDTDKRPIARYMFLLQFQVGIPSKSHENV